MCGLRGNTPAAEKSCVGVALHKHYRRVQRKARLDLTALGEQTTFHDCCRLRRLDFANVFTFFHSKCKHVHTYSVLVFVQVAVLYMHSLVDLGSWLIPRGEWETVMRGEPGCVWKV